VRPHLTSKDGRFRAGSEEDLERIGRSLAGEVVKVAEGIRTRPNPDLAAASSVFRLPYTGLPSERKIRDLSREAGERHRILQPLVLERRRRGHAVLEISGLRIGDLSLVTLPGEVMLEIGQQVEAGLPGRTMVLGYTNGNPGYLCTAASYPQGGYEPTCFFRTYHHPAPFTIDTERILVRTGIRVGRKLRGAA
jgi:hypothetical protein